MLHKHIKTRLEILIGQSSSSPLHPFEGFARIVETLIEIAGEQAKLYPDDFRWRMMFTDLHEALKRAESLNGFDAIDYFDKRSDEELIASMKGKE